MASTASMPPYMLSGVSVHQPPHLEGDASLATEILPGPPSLVSAQQSVQKRDPRKPSTAFSYLPTSDPGSTYSGIMHGTLIGQEHEGSRSKRSRVDNLTATGRAQRASARNHNGAAPAPDSAADSEVGFVSNPPPTSVDLEPYTMVVDDETSISRSNSSHNMQEGTSAGISGRPKRKDKGKAKEVDPPIIRVKEEPRTISLHSPEPPINLINNDDHCSSCRSHGALVYCDGCPRAFHLWCLDPPMESVDEGDSRWFCPSCMIRKHPPRKPPPSFLSPLIHQVDTTIPTEFQLPDDVRTFFKDVATGPKGSYVDSSEIKQPRLNRHGQLEDRDSHRLKDRNGTPVLCFRCGMSALPGGLAASAPATKRARRSSTKATIPETWKSIISCDYCSLHWHLDCLDPPMSTIPPFTKKWMCPNHYEKVLPPKRRIPKQNAPAIEITKPKQFNNGNIEVIHPEIVRTPQNMNKVAVDEVLINGRRYRVPERVIVLDFWSKLNKAEHQADISSNYGSGMSSPLTSLSSLDDLDDRLLHDDPLLPHNADDLRVAQLLCSLRDSKTRVASFPSAPSITNGSRKKTVDRSVQTEKDAVLTARSKTSKPIKPAITKRLHIKASGVNGLIQQPTSTLNDAVISPTESISPNAKRKRSTQVVQPEPSKRELRPRSKNNNDSSLTSVSSWSPLRRGDDSNQGSLPDDSIAAPPLPTSTLLGKSRSFHVKIEEADGDHVFSNGSMLAIGSSSITPATKANPSRIRAPRRQMQKEEEKKLEEREKKSKKRKERDDDFLGADRRDRTGAVDKGQKDKEKGKKERERKTIRTTSRHGYAPPASIAIPAPSTAISPSISTPIMPSLKIRLPRLSNVSIQHSSSIPNINGDTPTRL